MRRATQKYLFPSIFTKQVIIERNAAIFFKLIIHGHFVFWFLGAFWLDNQKHAPKMTSSRNNSTRSALATARKQTKRAKPAAPDKASGSEARPGGYDLALFADLPVAAVVFDENSRLVAANDLYRQVFASAPNVVVPGTPLGEILRYSVQEDLFDESVDFQALAEKIAKMAPGEITRTSLSFRDGIKVGQSVRKLENGGWIAAYTDISAVAKAEALAREAENRWNFALETARQGVWDSNLQTGQVFYSHMWRAIRGLDDMDAVPSTAEFWRNRLHPDDRDYVLDAIKRQNDGEVIENGIEYRERHKDGHWIWILSRGRVVAWDESGKPSRIIGTDTDITETRSVEAALTETEARWNLALQGTGQGVWDADLVAGTVFYSSTWREMRGFSPDEDIDSSKQAWLARVHPDDRDRIHDTIVKQDEGVVLHNFLEYREQHRDGHYIWIQSRGEPVAWKKDGRPTRVIGVDIDITERKELELQVRESLQLLNTTLDNFPGGICVHDKDFILKVANKGYYEINGLDEEQFPVGSTLQDILRHIVERGDYGPFDADTFIEARLKDFTRPAQNKTEYSLPDGRTIESKYMPLEGGGCLITFEDITARKELELKVRESLQLLNTTLDSFPGGICLYDKDLVLQVANKGYYEINDLDESWFPVGSRLEDILRYHAENGHYGEVDIDAYVEERLAEAQLATPSEFDIARKDGATIRYKRHPLQGGGFIVTFEDITESVKAEAEKSQLEKELIQAQRLESLGTLASGIAHEINTPIQYIGDNILFVAQSLRDVLEILQRFRKALRPPIDPGLIAEQVEAIAELEKSLDLAFILEELPLALEQSAQGVQQVATIVKAVKEFSHPGQEQKTEFDINAIIETTLIVSKNQWKYVAEVEMDLDRSLPMIMCLPGDLGQALLNLVVNAAFAIDAAKREKGIIRITSCREGDSVVVRVADNGCGIPSSIMNRIYDPFFTTKDIGKGTGQGLAIAFSAVTKKHGGTIECTSEDGIGTTFTLKIPIVAAENTDLEKAS